MTQSSDRSEFRALISVREDGLPIVDVRPMPRMRTPTSVVIDVVYGWVSVCRGGGQIKVAHVTTEFLEAAKCQGRVFVIGACDGDWILPSSVVQAET